MQTNDAESLETKVKRYYIRIKLEKQNSTMVSKSKQVRVTLYLHQTGINLVVAPNFIVLNNTGQRNSSYVKLKEQFGTTKVCTGVVIVKNFH